MKLDRDMAMGIYEELELNRKGVEGMVFRARQQAGRAGSC